MTATRKNTHTAASLSQSPERRDLIRKCRAACHRQGIGDDDRKAIQKSVTGKASMSDMTPADLAKLLSHLNRGWAGPSGHNPHLGKTKALWWSLYWLAAIDDPGDIALSGFVKRQTGISALRFLDARLSPAVIEALKSWATRCGVEWPDEHRLAKHRRLHNPMMSMDLAERHAVLVTIGESLFRAGVIKVSVTEYLRTVLGGGANQYHWDANHLDACIKLLGRMWRRHQRKSAQ